MGEGEGICACAYMSEYINMNMCTYIYIYRDIRIESCITSISTRVYQFDVYLRSMYTVAEVRRWDHGIGIYSMQVYGIYTRHSMACHILLLGLCTTVWVATPFGLGRCTYLDSGLRDLDARETE